MPDETVTVKELSEKLGVPAREVMRHLLDRGIFATIKQTIDSKLASEITQEVIASGGVTSCYRCRKNPCWRGFAWCLECSIDRFIQELGNPPRPPLPRRDTAFRSRYNILAELVRKYSQYPEFPGELLAKARKLLESSNPKLFAKCPRCGYPNTGSPAKIRRPRG